MKPQMILVKYVDDYNIMIKDKFNVQFAGMSDRKPMELQVWQIPCDSQKEAIELRDQIKASGIMFIGGKK